MPQAAVAAVAIGASVLGGASLLGAVSSVAISAGLNYVASEFFGPQKPKGPAFSQADRKLTFVDPAGARPILYGSQRVGGRVTFARVTGTGSATPWPNDTGRVLHLIVALAGHEVAAINNVYFAGQALSLDQNGDEQGNYQGDMRVRKYTGSWNQTADPTLTTVFGDLDANFRGRNIAYLYVQMRNTQGVFPNGVNATDFAADVLGRKFFDQRDENHVAGDPDTYGYDTNPIMATQDYLRGVPMKIHDGSVARFYGVGADDARIDQLGHIAEANACDEAVPLLAGGSENRYTLTGKVDSGETPQRTLQEMLSACAGKVVNTGGLWSLTAGIARTPVMDIKRNVDLRGPLEIQHATSLETAFTAATGRFVNAATQEMATYPLVKVDAFATASGGKHRTQNIDLPFTGSVTMAQRLVKIMIYQANAQMRFRPAVSLVGLKAVAGDWVTYTDDLWELDGTSFEVDELSMGLGRDGGESGAPVPQISMTLVETSADTYAWDKSEERAIADPPFDGLPSGLIVPQPASIAADVIAFGDFATVRVTLGLSESDLAVRYRHGYRLEGSTETVLLSERRNLVRDIPDIPIGNHVFVGVAVNKVGRESSAIELPFVVGPPNPVERVIGLELAGRAHGTQFEGPDAEFAWRASAVQNPVGLDAELGLDLEGDDFYFRDFLCRVRMPAPDSRLLREEAGLKDPRYGYLLDMNRQDSRRLTLSGPQRKFRFECVQRTRFGESAVSFLDVENPAPDQVPAVSVNTFAAGLVVPFTHVVRADDHAGFIIKYGATGFDPETEGAILWQGDGDAYVSGLTAGTYFIRVAEYDSFGLAGLNWSGELEVEVGIGVDGELIAQLEQDVADIEQNVDIIADQWTVTVTTDATTGERVIGGINLSADPATAQTRMVVLATQFGIVNKSQDGTLFTPFVVDGNAVFLDTVFVRNITAANMDVDELTAITGAFGDATVSGELTSTNGKLTLDFTEGNIRVRSVAV